jgi:uncharacterized protein YodC (DUF2158 family)
MEAAMAFEPGNIVVLKSGGFQMTVADVTDDGVQCLWLGEEGDLFRETLPAAVLELVPARDPEDEDEDGDEDENDEDEDEEDADEEDEEEAASARKVA